MLNCLEEYNSFQAILQINQPMADGLVGGEVGEGEKNTVGLVGYYMHDASPNKNW